jgi:hypothetical protein
MAVASLKHTPCAVEGPAGIGAGAAQAFSDLTIMPCPAMLGRSCGRPTAESGEPTAESRAACDGLERVRRVGFVNPKPNTQISPNILFTDDKLSYIKLTSD